MIVVIDCSWTGSAEKKVGKSKVVFNTFDPNADFVIDLSSRLFSAMSSKYPANKRCFLTGEPSIFMNYDAQRVEKIGAFYGARIFSHHAALQKFSQTEPFTFGQTWVCWKPSVDKEFGIGGIFSGKSNPLAEGYSIRKSIIELQDQISINGIVYNPSGKWKKHSFTYPLSTKEPSLRHAFHLSVENTSEHGYFTEKLIDPMLCGCVPVYYGDPEIWKYFDVRGMILLDLNRIVPQLNGLTTDDYTSRIPFMQDNKERALRHVDWIKRVVSRLEELRC